VTVALSLILSVTGGVIFIGRAINANNHKWCQIVDLFDDAYRTTPPTTATGRQIATSFHNLRQQLDC
jgi:hypothetical protein